MFGDAGRRAYADGEVVVSGREGLFVCGIDSVDAHPDCRGGAGWPRARVRVSGAWSGPRVVSGRSQRG